MGHRRRRSMPFILLLLVVAALWSVQTVAQDDDPPPPVTVDDPDIPVAELELLLKPLPKAQLLIEADAWQGLVQEKAEEIAAVEIEVERKNQEIAKQAEQEADQEADQQTEQAAGDVSEAEQEEHKVEKVDLLEQVATLREERTLLIDRLNAAVAALETKTAEDDADTLAKIQDFRLYAQAVRGIKLDLTDTTSTWLAVKGWLLSDEGGKRVLWNIIQFFGILIIAWFIAGIASTLIHRALGRVPGTSKLLEDFLIKAVRWVVLAIGFIMALAALEVSIGPLLALVGAAGFIVAFALQDSLSNFANGMMILLFRPFDVGDVVDAGGVSGTVQSVSLVSTTIKTFDNKVMLVPNNKVWQDVITNASGVNERRVDLEFGIGYDDDIDQAHAILEEIVTSHPQVLKEPEPTIRMNALADSSVNFIVRPWAKTADYWTVYWDLTREVKRRFDAADIGIPFPQRDVHLYFAGGAEKLASLTGAPAAEPPVQTRDGGLDD